MSRKFRVDGLRYKRITPSEKEIHARHFFPKGNTLPSMFCALILSVSVLLAAILLPCPARAETVSSAPIAPVHFEIKITDIAKTEVNQLAREGINITNRHGTTAWAYVTQDQYQQILDKGYAAELVVFSEKKIDTPLAEDYPTYAEVAAELAQIAADNPGICQLVNIGQSYQGRDLLFLKISDNVATEEDEPEFKYISTMHGDEKGGMDLMLRLSNYLVDNYGGTDDAGVLATNLVDNMEIWIMPIMNPDGYSAIPARRYNLQGYDLNRHFPDRIEDPVNSLVNYDDDPRPVEVQRIMSWAFGQSTVLSANIHGGALVVNYPYDGNDSHTSIDSPTPDDSLFEELCLTYSRLNTTMYYGEFSEGITNGADWYTVYGGMQDWNYVWMGCMEVTLELYNRTSGDTDNSPPYSETDTIWSENKDPLLAYMGWALKGVRGVVTDKCTGQPVSATITVDGSSFEVFTDPDVGDYHRILLPSETPYTVTVSADGYETQVFTDVAVLDGDATRLDVALAADSVPVDFNCDTCLGVEDSILILQALAGLPSAIGDCPEANPVFDSQLGLDDALYVLRQLAQ